MDEITAARRQDYHIAETFLLRYEVERRKYNEEKAQYMSPGAVDVNVGRRGSISRPTETTALQGVKFDADHEWTCHWLQAVEIVESNLTKGKRYLVQLRREAYRRAARRGGRGRRGWVGYVQSRYISQSGRDVSEVTVRRWVSDIIWRVVDAHLRIVAKKL